MTFPHDFGSTNNLENLNLQRLTNIMSFTTSRKYQRAILRPLQLSSTVKCEQLQLSRPRSQSQICSSAWRATTHVFTGTGNREVHPAWSPLSFDQNPSAIPDDDKHNIPYDPKSTSCQQSLYHIYDRRDPEQTVEAGLVPAPSLVAKRYIPIYNAQNAGEFTQEKVTMLMLPGMGVPKEVRTSSIKTTKASYGSDSYFLVSDVRTVSRDATSPTPGCKR